MIRERVTRWSKRGDPGFTWRGGEVSRLEGFSDAVFGFAITLLVVTQSIPKSFDDLIDAMRGFPAFALTFVILVGVWRRHYLYFRRFALEDAVTVWLNSALLFLIVFYVFPLRFVFSLMLDSLFGIGAAPSIATGGQVRALFVVYGAGFASIFLLYAGMYHHAWRHRDDLALDDLERECTRIEVRHGLGMAVVGAASIVAAALLPDHYAGSAGFVYFLVGVVETWHGAAAGAAHRRHAARTAGATSPAAPTGSTKSSRSR